jgi:hypothetical protein
MRRLDLAQCDGQVFGIPAACCGFQRIAARHSDLIAATIPI